MVGAVLVVDSALASHVHLPFFCVAKSRICRMGSSAIRRTEPFAVGRLWKKERLKASADPRSYLLDNTIISRHFREIIGMVRAAIGQGSISRIVVQGEAI